MTIPELESMWIYDNVGESENVYVPDPPEAEVVPFAALKAAEESEMPEVVVIFEPPLTTISGLTRIVI